MILVVRLHLITQPNGSSVFQHKYDIFKIMTLSRICYAPTVKGLKLGRKKVKRCKDLDLSVFVNRVTYRIAKSIWIPFVVTANGDVGSRHEINSDVVNFVSYHNWRKDVWREATCSYLLLKLCMFRYRENFYNNVNVIGFSDLQCLPIGISHFAKREMRNSYNDPYYQPTTSSRQTGVFTPRINYPGR